MWDLDCEESWELKNWCCWAVVLEKILEGPLDYTEIQPVYSKGDQSWVFIGRTDGEAETPVLWPPHVKSWLIGGWDGWMALLTQWTWVWAPGIGDGPGGLACWSPWGRKESDTTERLNRRHWGSSWAFFLLPHQRKKRESHDKTLGSLPPKKKLSWPQIILSFLLLMTSSPHPAFYKSLLLCTAPGLWCALLVPDGMLPGSWLVE